MITSLLFWFILPAAAILYWSVDAVPWIRNLPGWRDWFLFVVSLGFLAEQDPKGIAALCVMSGLVYLGARTVKRPARWVSWGLIVMLLGVLAYYKYAPPLIRMVRGAEAAKLDAVVMPLGISYFTFKLIHYSVDASRKTLPPHSAAQFFAWVFFFPMFAAGPIERFEHFLANRGTQLDRAQLLDGGTRITFGLIKKFVFVELWLDRTSARGQGHVFDAIPLVMPALGTKSLLESLDHLRPAFAWQYVINHFFAGYIDFSAYNDIALGAALVFGVKLGENFDWPILATNPGEFWKRWHMSLSNFCQRYIYLPTMATTRNPYLAIYATMIAMSAWHEGSMSFLVRGLYWGTLLVMYVTWGRIRRAMDWQITHPAAPWFARVFMFVAASAAVAFTATQAPFTKGLRLFATLFGVHV